MDSPRDREELSDGSVLNPEDLDITEEEKVEELDETRFVIGAEGRPQVEDTDDSLENFEAEHDVSGPTAADSSAIQSAEPSQESEPTDQIELRGSDVKRWISANLRRTDSQYAYRLAAKTGDDISHQQLASDDIGMAFDGLLMWYAQQVGDGTAVEDTLGILLAESNIRVRFPVVGMIAYLEKHDLSPEDSIADLLSVIRDHDGLVFPRGTKR
ncbi:DUF7500 family protein [Halodesulfurarchaeum sp.]|uniref:DUF7500 family protein n=1 Tax=Halodesulfurarchaeum sp. TaxID=1980530 RepID=UPI001BB8711E|nr:hypothetical protein [Halodesulfurarchaeum sp.]